MKPHQILTSFPGSQHGHDFQHFTAGTTADLSDGLAAIAVKEGWAVPLATGGPVVVTADPPTPGEALLPHAPDPEDSTDETLQDDEEKAVAAAPDNKMKKPVKGRK